MALAFALAALPTFPQTSGVTLLFRNVPTGEVLQDSLLRFHVVPAGDGKALPDGCGLYRGPSPAGNRLEGHPTRVAAEEVAAPDSTGRIFRFRPSEMAGGAGGAGAADGAGGTGGGGSAPRLGLGFHHLVAACRDGQDVSPEIPLLVVSRSSVSIATPKSLETSASPSISWSPVPGVPAYHLLLSDQALQIDTQKGSVGGASVIWQAITTGTSIAYGTPDPSGNFDKVAAPPLSPGVTYNLVVLNNYDGRSALATSSKAQALKLFSIQAPAAPLSRPRNLRPAQGSRLSVSTDTAIQLRWSASRSSAGPANTYKAYIYSLEEEDGSEILVPIWSTEVTDTTAVVDARRTLLSKRYVWKVFALGASGTGVVGDTTSFTYRNDVQTLSISVTAAVTAAGTASGGSGLGDVRIEVTPVDGGASPIPLFTPSGGKVEKTMAIGRYDLRFSKDGYVAQTRTVTLSDTGTLRVDVDMAAAEGRILGRVVDAGGLALVNARVVATAGGSAGAGATGTVEAITDAQGSFLLGVGAGVHAVSVSKADYLTRPDTLVTVEALRNGGAADLGTVVLSRPRGSLAGTVANDKGIPLSGCQVVIRSSAGAVLRTLLTDDKGGFSAWLAPGVYAVAASRTGFTTEEKTVRLTDAASLAFRLIPGASVLKGRISIRSWPTSSSSTSLPAAGAALELRNILTGAVQKTMSDLRGDYTFSADTGTFVLKAADADRGRARPDSVLLRIGQAGSTVIRDLEMPGHATVKGTVTLDPSVPADPSSITVSLLRLPSLAPAGSVPAMAAAGGGMAFSIEGVPDGDYRVTCGLAGHGLDSEPSIAIRDGVWLAGVPLVLRPASKSVTFTLRHGSAVLPGKVHLASPLSATIPGGSRLSPAAPGTYVLGALPDSIPIIPLSRMAFGLPASGSADTAMTLALPFSHEPPAGPLAFSDGKVSLILRTAMRVDSAWIVHGYGSPTDTFRVPASQLAGSVDEPKTLRFDPGARGGLLSYYFILRSGSITWSNEAPARRFRATVEASRELAFLRVSGGDSLPLPARSRVDLRVHAYDAAGRRIDTAVDRRGKVEWGAAAALSARLESRKGRAATLATGAARAPSARGAASAGTAAGAGTGTGTFRVASTPGAGDWDSLMVSVTLDGITRRLSVPAKVVTARINRLVISSTLGETPAIPSPAGFGLFVSAFDTATSPPTPLVPSPSIVLDPPEAGEVRDLEVLLDPRFIGPLRIRAVHVNPDGTEVRAELGEGRDSLLIGLNVGQTLRAGDTARLLVHDREFEMRVPDSALTEGQTVVRMFRRGLAKSFASGVSEAVTGRVYEISNPSGAAFARSFRLNLGVPAGFRDRNHVLRRFEVAGLEWASPADSSAADTTFFGGPSRAADITLFDGHYYALLAESRGLSAETLEIVPNPFSPLVTAVRDGNTQPGTRIRLRPDSDRGSEITVSIRIYNMDGELIRILVDHKTIPKAVTDFYWDGRADGGRWARNGRYLAKITLKAAGSRQVKHILRPVVVFQ